MYSTEYKLQLGHVNSMDEQKLHPIWHSYTLIEQLNNYLYNVNVSDLADHGGIGVDLSYKIDSRLTTCKMIKNEKNHSNEYVAKYCCAPLFSPVKFSNFDDPCQKELESSNSERTKFCSKFNMLRRNLKKEHLEYLTVTYDKLKKANEENTTPEDINIPEEYFFLSKNKPNVIPNQVFNFTYSGGCLDALKIEASSDDNTFLIHSVRNNLTSTTLNKSCASEFNQHFTNIKQDQIKLKGGNIYQIVLKNFHSNYYCCVRQKKRCQLFSLETKDESLEVIRMQNLKFHNVLSSVSLSTHIAGEFAVSTDDGFLMVYNVDSGSIWEGGERKSSIRNWCCDFGAHPRALILLNENSLSSYDLRYHRKLLRPRTLLTIEQPLLLPWDEFSVLKRNPLQECQYFVGSKNHLLLVDERYPNRVVGKWNHMLNSPPLYSSVLEMQKSSELLFFLSSQNSRETCCLQIDAKSCKQKLQPITLSPPWHTGSSHDFCTLLNLKGLVISDAQRKRCDIPYIGVVALEETNQNDQFTVFHLTSVGELYSQNYENQRTCRKGNSNLLIESHCEVNDSVYNWLESTKEDDTVNIVEEYDLEFRDIQAIYNAITKEMPCNEYCPVCTSEINETMLDENLICSACGLNIELSNNLLNVSKQGKVLSRFDILNTTESPVNNNDELTCNLIDVNYATSNPLVTKLLNTWNQENILDVQEDGERNEEENMILEVLYPQQGSDMAESKQSKQMEKCLSNGSLLIDLCDDVPVVLESDNEDLGIISSNLSAKSISSKTLDKKTAKKLNLSANGF